MCLILLHAHAGSSVVLPFLLALARSVDFVSMCLDLAMLLRDKEFDLMTQHMFYQSHMIGALKCR